MFLFRRNRSGPLFYAYVATLVALLVAVFVLHVSGTTLVIVRVARIILVVAIIAVGAMLRRRNARAEDAARQSEPGRD
jgi:hypothetical protein